MEKEAIRKDQQLKEMKATLMPSNQAQVNSFLLRQNCWKFIVPCTTMREKQKKWRISCTDLGSLSQTLQMGLLAKKASI